MDPNRFDAIARQLGTARSRRGMLKTLGAAALGAVGLTGVSPSIRAAPNGKVGICHRTGSANSPYTYLTVSQNAVRAHEAHGDTINPDFDNDPANCGGCGIVCPGPSSGSGTAICTDGTCDISCASRQNPFLTLCNGACVDTRFPDNCGACGNVCPDPCECQQSYNGIFCYSGRSGSRSNCKVDADCMAAGETCQDIRSSGWGTCTPIGCSGHPEVCPPGSQCTADVQCLELCGPA